MGFIMTGNKTQIFEYNKSDGTYSKSNNPPYYSWAMRVVWQKIDPCIVWKNDTGMPMTIKKFSAKTCSCNSGTTNYYVWGSDTPVQPCKGYGGKYYSYISVTSETDTNKLLDATYQDSARVTQDVPNSDYNMNYAGSGPRDTAVFGNYPYAGNQGLKFREFEISDCPTIPPGGHAIIHIGISDWNSGSTPQNTTIRFILDASAVEVDIEPEESGYIWVYSKKDKKWYLKKPYYRYDSNLNKWINVEDLNK